MMNSGARSSASVARSDLILAFLAALLGLVVRIAGPAEAAFPLNDGGLFYRMILDLQANHLVLPVFTTYNFENIPFAYPPLAFYFTGALASLLRLNVLSLLRILPSLFSAAGVPVFYYLSRRILKSGQMTALAATTAFMFVARGFEWQIMGGGITRALGFLFGLLTLLAAHKMFSESEHNRYILPTVIFGTLTVLSHPEATIQTLLAALIFY